MGDHCLLLAETENDRDKTLSFLFSALGLQQEEAKLRLRTGPGFLLENSDRETAMTAHARAAEAGLKTMVVENRSLPLLPPPAATEKLEFHSDGFRYRDKNREDFARYDSLAMLAAAAIEIFLQPETADELETDLLEQLRLKYFPSLFKPGAAPPRKPPAAQPRKEIVFYADIFILAAGRQSGNRLPPRTEPVRLRIRHDEFDFSGLGPAKQYSSVENFRLLLDELQARTFSKPFMNRAFTGISKRHPVRDFALPSPAAYEKELLWLACLGKAGRDL